MDGNGRWASKRLLPRIAGHKQGLTAFKACIQDCLVRNIGVLTVFAFSSENWKRPVDEVSGLMELFSMAVAREVPRLCEDGVRLYFVGNRDGLTERVRAEMAKAEEATSLNARMILNVCFNYGGHWDICQSAARVSAAGLPINEANLAAHMALSHVQDPDLLIRTGGERRISNFLLWQLAYSELYFTDVYWPDFDGQALDQALAEYGQRQRRFGRTPEQVATPLA